MRSGRAWHVRWRWGLVLAGVAVLCCLPAAASVLPISVPRLTARQLEQRILGSQRLSFSGYAESSASFGLPPLPAFSSVTPLLDGVTRLRAWQASPDRWRVDTLSDAGENDTYQLGDNTYVWDSGEELLTGIYGAQPIRLPRAADLVPSSLATRLISWAGPEAKLSLLPPRRVAGQSAAGLAVSPASSRSTIAQADIWAAPGTGLPLRVEIFGHGAAQPALESQFLQVGPWTPGGGVLTPQWGPGAGYTSTTPADFAGVLKNLASVTLPDRLAGFTRQRSPVPEIGVYGSGLTAFAVLAFTPGTGGHLLDDALDAGAAQLTFPRGIKDIRDLLTGLNADGVTIFLSSHLLPEVSALCTRIGVLDSGRLVLQDQLADLEQPTGRVLVSTCEPERAVAALDGLVEHRDGTELVVRSTDPAALNARLVAAGVPVQSLVGQRRSLEEIVLDVTGAGSDQFSVRGETS